MTGHEDTDDGGEAEAMQTRAAMSARASTGNVLRSGEEGRDGMPRTPLSITASPARARQRRHAGEADPADSSADEGCEEGGRVGMQLRAGAWAEPGARSALGGDEAERTGASTAEALYAVSAFAFGMAVM